MTVMPSVTILDFGFSILEERNWEKHPQIAQMTADGEQRWWKLASYPTAAFMISNSLRKSVVICEICGYAF
jgi:hypothetical protein